MRTPSSIFFACLALAAFSAAQVIVRPPDLQVGDTYRLAFMTQGERDATSANIADYNSFVAAEAAASPRLAALQTQWRAIASTATVTARDNTDTDPTPPGATGVPIYNLSGLRMADDYDDLWDGSLNATLSTMPIGGVQDTYVWTGTASNGLLAESGSTVARPLGSAQPFVGYSFSFASWWISRPGFTPGNGANRRLYAISDVLVVNTEDLGPGCPIGPPAFRFVPNANGGHDVAEAGNAAFDPVLGTKLDIVSDNFISVAVDLGFAFPFPGATGTAPEQVVRIAPEGRIVPDSSGVLMGDQTPTIGELTSSGYPMICPFWTDLRPTSSVSGGIWFKSEPGAATFTWNQVPQQGPTSPLLTQITFQCTLFDDGQVLVVLEDTASFNSEFSFTNADCLIGVSSGDVASPTSAIDLSHIDGGIPADGTPAYEFFPFGDFDLNVTVPTLDVLSGPLLGGSFAYRLIDAPATAGETLYLIGTNALPTPVPLSAVGFGSPCNLGVEFVDIQIAIAGPGGQMPASQIAIPSTPTSLIGFELVVQGVTNGAPFLAPLLTTNTVRGVIGG